MVATDTDNRGASECRAGEVLPAASASGERAGRDPRGPVPAAPAGWRRARWEEAGTWIKAPLSSLSLSSCLNSTVTALSQSMAAISTSVVLFMTIPPKKSVARKPEDEGEGDVASPYVAVLLAGLSGRTEETTDHRDPKAAE